MTTPSPTMRLLAVVTVIGAGILWFGLLGRIVQLSTLAWKIGDGRISGGSAAFVAFVFTSVACAGCGFVVARRAPRTRIGRIGKAAGIASASAGVTWLLLVASSFVEITRP